MNEVLHKDSLAIHESMASAVKGLPATIIRYWRDSTHSRRIQSACAGIALLAVLAGIVWWVLQPNWKVLYAGLTPDEVREIATTLGSSNITYDLSTDGTTLRVLADQLDKARLASASKASGKQTRLGFELFDKPNWAGSEFDEKVNYQRALEGELEHTIDSLSDIQSSRVHLVLPHDSLYLGDQRESKASVVIRLRSRYLAEHEAESIKSLIANAVDNLKPESVVLLDGNGNELSSHNDASQTKEAYESLLTAHILETLEPVVGVGNVHAIVNVDYDLSSREIVNEAYDPASVVTLTMQRSEQNSGPQVTAQGVPGTATNAPNQQPPLFPTQKAETQSSKQESGAYGASKKTEHLREGPGKISRLSAAIIVNDRTISSSDAKKQSLKQPWTQDELKQLVALSEASVGFDAKRGDSLIVQNLTFDAPKESRSSVFNRFLRQSILQESIIKEVVIGGLFLTCLLFVIRPAILTLVKPSLEPNLLPVSVQEKTSERLRVSIQEELSQTCFQEVIGQIQNDPIESARILQTWIRSEGNI